MSGPRETRMKHPRRDLLTSISIENGTYDKAILPLGSTEYHGSHLPYGSDTIAAETLALVFARELGETLVLPSMPFGVSHYHLAFPGQSRSGRRRYPSWPRTSATRSCVT